MKTITYYKLDGEKVKTEELNEKTVGGCHGMKVRCILNDGTEKIGFANCCFSFEKQAITVESDFEMPRYIALERYINLDEETNTFKGDISHRYDIGREKVFISSISHMDAILYSGLRWGSRPTNKFNINI